MLWQALCGHLLNSSGLGFLIPLHSQWEWYAEDLNHTILHDTRDKFTQMDEWTTGH